jgi:hypothetical protein
MKHYLLFLEAVLRKMHLLCSAQHSVSISAQDISQALWTSTTLAVMKTKGIASSGSKRASDN